jgi:hypothetical protein
MPEEMQKDTDIWNKSIPTQPWPQDPQEPVNNI